MAGTIAYGAVGAAMQAARARLQDATILVDTNMMVAKANAVSAAISNMENSFNEMQGIVARIGGDWVGEASEYHRRMFDDEKDNIVKILNRLKEHPEDLKLMAAGYAETEKDLTGENQQLRNDYI